jgi:hypothetical protein
MEFVELFVSADQQIKDPTKYIERWNDLNTRAKIYKTIEGWDTCTPNVLANKIKKVQTYYTKLTDSIREYQRQMGKKNSDIDNAIYRDWLRNADFDKLEAKFELGVIPLTWSVSKLKNEDRTFDFLVYLNKNWFNYFIRWLYTHLEQMKERLETSKEQTKAKKKEIKTTFLEEEVECPCGGHYKLTNKSHHFRSKKHQSWEATAETKPEKKQTKKKQPKIKMDPEYHERVEEFFREHPELEYNNEEYQNIVEQFREIDEELREEERKREIERQEEAKKAEEARLYWENARQNKTEYKTKTIIRKRKTTTEI